MPDFTIFIPPVMGAVIGFCTNWIAIAMLFRPYEKKYLWGLPLPFTPGLIPKDQARLAQKIAQTLGTRVLTSEALSKALANSISDIHTAFVQERLPEAAAQIRTWPEKYPHWDAQCEAWVHQLVRENTNGFTGLFVNPHKIYAGIKSGLDAFLADTDNLRHLAKQIEGFLTVTAESAEPAETTDPTSDGQEKKAGFHPAFEKALLYVARQINIEAVIEQQINALSVKEMETLILAVVRKELHAIMAMGGVLGFLLGWIPVLF